MDKYTAFIVDDEVSCIDLLSHFISKYCPEITVVGVPKDIEEARTRIQETKPQILFLDIQVNNSLIFDLLDKINCRKTEVILTTAYQEYTIRAFNYDVVNYLLKPIMVEDLIKSVNRCIAKIKEKKQTESIETEGKLLKNKAQNSKIIIPSMDKTDVVKTDEIVYLKSDGRYTTFFLNNKTQIVASKNLGEYSTILPQETFFRIHHSYIINVDFLDQIDRKKGCFCVLKNNVELPVAIRRQDALFSFLKNRQ